LYNYTAKIGRAGQERNTILTVFLLIYKLYTALCIPVCCYATVKGLHGHKNLKYDYDQKTAIFAVKLKRMGSHEKLLERFLRLPKDFTWDELKSLLKKYGYIPNNKGKTSGSRISFEKEDSNIALNLHKPHPENTLKPYQMKDTLEFLKRIGVIRDESLR
jgi:hypothetical protein